MGSWGNTDDAANSVYYAPAQFNKTANTDNQTALFGNTTADAFVTNLKVGQFGVTPDEAAAARAGANTKMAHAGWNLRIEGTGGRAGRVQYETLVAMSTITGDSDSLPPVPTITISGQPSNTSVVEPATGTFSVTASATAGTLSYQWQKAEAGNTTFANISGATSSTYTTGATTVADDNGDVYRVVVSGTLGAAPVTSANATLTVVPTITISSQPSNTSVVEPATGTFSVTANTTSGTLSYQWQKAEAGNTTFANIVGANTNTYTTDATTVADDNGDVYRVVVSGTLGAAPVTSANATLTVTL